MTRKIYLGYIASVVLFGIVSLSQVMPVQAVTSETSPSSSPSSQTRSRADTIRADADKRRADIAAKVAEKKDQTRIKRCEAIQARVKDRYTITSQRAREMEERISQRLDRAQAFVSKRNLTVANGTTLLADVDAKRQAAVAAAGGIRTAAEGFSCSNDDAKQQASLIRDEVAVFSTAAKDYRQSVQAYFTAVIAAYSAANPTVSPSSGGAQ